MPKLYEKVYAGTFLSYSKLFSRRNMNNYLRKAIKEHVRKDMKIISFGSGGSIAKELKKNGIKFQQADIDPKRNPDIVLDITNMKKLKDNSIDVIFCMEVLEHVKNPFSAVSEIRRVLKKGGILIASTPFIFPIHEVPVDYFRYTKYGILELFKDFKCLELKERNSYVMSTYVLFTRLMTVGTIKERLIGVLLFPIYLLMLPFFLILSVLVPHKYSTTGYFYVFRK